MALGVEAPASAGAAADASPSHGHTRAAVRGASPLAFAGVLANGANVLVTLVIARELSTRNYGAYNQLFALFFVLSMPGSALVVGVVRRVTQWQRSGEEHLVHAWAARIRRIALLAVLGVLLAGLLVRAPLARELSLPGPGGVTEVLTAGAAWCLLCIDRGLLQASRLYNPLGINLLAEGLLRAVLTVAFVVAGAGPAGAMAALLLGIFAADLHARWVLHRQHTASLATSLAITLAADEHAAMAPPAVAVTGPSLAVDVMTALAALGLIGLLQNLDVIVLGRQAPGHSGAYAAVSIASKALVFAALVLANFLLPEAASRRQLGQHALHQLGGTLALLAAPAAALVLLGAIAPHQILTIAFGERLTDASSALLPLALAMTCLGATVLFTHYLLAVGQRLIVLALALATAVAIPLLITANGSAAPTAEADLGVQAVLAVISGLLVLRAARRYSGPGAAAAGSATPPTEEAPSR
jgi:O-antigen/teichoic acid export membrane protein